MIRFGKTRGEGEKPERQTRREHFISQFPKFIFVFEAGDSDGFYSLVTNRINRCLERCSTIREVVITEGEI